VETSRTRLQAENNAGSAGWIGNGRDDTMTITA